MTMDRTPERQEIYPDPIDEPHELDPFDLTDIDIDDPDFDDDDIATNPLTEPTIGEIIDSRMSRRQALGGLAATAALGMVAFGGTMTSRVALANGSTLTFEELAQGYDETHHVAKGYKASYLIGWGDPVEGNAPAFDPMNQTAAAQEKQFGYNNDYIGYLPLPAGSNNSEHGLLCINHEYTNAHLMFPGVEKKDIVDTLTHEQALVEIAAHGHSVVEIKKTDGTWEIMQPSGYNRRISALSTPMKLSGPAAGHDRLKTSADPTGYDVIGTLNNCAGGRTPWGTILFAEENFHGYFGGDPAKTAEARNYKRYGLKEKSRYAWSRHVDRFNLDKEPNEPNRFGWMVEFDPYDPTSVPVKRTSLGRFKHEGATTIVNKDGRVVVYTGDDQRFDYIYKFVSNGRLDPNNRSANRDLLDDGTLFVAKFNDDGTLNWLPLVWGTGPLTPENDFASQADVLIETRRAADLLGATPMDRPEDVEPNPVTGVVYAMLTNNTKRKPEQVDAVNPRANNKDGHVLEMIPPGGRGIDADHAALTFRWDLPVICGDPSKPEDKAKYHADVSANGWLTTPDNCAIDAKGRLWISTDGAPKSGIADGIWAMDTEGPGRALTRHFFRAPRGAEVCGPEFTPDGTTLFCAVQHPADEKNSTFAAPTTRWPDFKDGMPPRPSVVAITKDGGGTIGS